MWRLHRYYLKELGTSAVLTFLVLFGIVLVATVYRGIERAQGSNLLDAALITFFWAADTFPHLLAISLLVATVMTFARASQDREITAIRAAGISPRVPMVAALLIGLAFSIAGSYAQHYLIPRAHYQKYRVVADIARQWLTNAQMTGDKMSFGKGSLLMSWRRKDLDGHLHDVVIRIGKSEPGSQLQPGRLYWARETWVELGRDGETIDLVLNELRDGGGEQYFSGIARVAASVRKMVEQGRRREGDRDLTTDQLLGEVLRGVHPNPDGARFTVHRRSCFAVMPFLFAPIGFCIGIAARERGRMAALLYSMVPLGIFYGCVVLAPSLVRALDWPPIAWLPAAAVAVLGTPYCWRWLKV